CNMLSFFSSHVIKLCHVMVSLSLCDSHCICCCPSVVRLFSFSVSVSVQPSAVLKLNDEATLQCEVKGQPQGCEVKWQSPNTDSPTNPSTVQLKPVTSSHKGAWECIITCNTQALGIKTFVCMCGQRNIKMCVFVLQSLQLQQSHQPNQTAKVRKPATHVRGNDDASPGLLGLAWWVWVAIGVGCLVAILLMVCVIVLCVRVKRRKVMPLSSSFCCISS
uniref:Ig-like domain-containing protein n=1 Tax=Neolamprologus brichardi TaxID=32507 RepID=A0A3Q4H080_NEOBR